MPEAARERAGSRPLLLLVQYPGAQAARSARANFLRAYMPEAGSDGVARMENQRWTLASAEGDLLAVVFEAASREQATALVSEITWR